MKTIKLLEVQPLMSTIEKFKGVKLSISTLHKLYLLAKEMDEHLTFFQEQTKKIIEEFGERDEDGEFLYTEDKTGILIKDEYKDKFLEKMNELNEIEIELPEVEFKLSEFEKIEGTIEEMFPFFAKFL